MKHFGTADNTPTGLEAHGPQVCLTLTREVTPQQTTPGPSCDVWLMIDTGADCTLMSDSILSGLGLVPIRYRLVAGISQKPEEYPVYRVALLLSMGEQKGSPTKKIVFISEVVGVPSSNKGHEGLLGRDFLRYFEFVYRGHAGDFELRFPQQTSQPNPQTQKNREKRARKK